MRRLDAVMGNFATITFAAIMFSFGWSGPVIQVVLVRDTLLFMFHRTAGRLRGREHR